MARTDAPGTATSGALRSLWDLTSDATSVRARGSMPEGIGALETVPVCVIGAGMAGLSTAYELARRGHGVLVLDDGDIGSGETGRTTAHLATAFDDGYQEIERLHGTEAMQQLGSAFRSGVDRIETIVKTEAIACDFTRLDGWWWAAKPEDGAWLEAEADAARRAGFTDVSLVEASPVPLWPRTTVLHCPRQAQMHPARYLAGLAAAIRKYGGQIITGAHVHEVHDADQDGWCTVAVDTTHGTHPVRARDVVVATNVPINDRVVMHTKQYPYRTYVVAHRIAPDAVPLGLFWDTAEPYHYIRRYAASGERDGGADDVLIVGGEDHHTGHHEDELARFDRLEAWTRERFPVGDLVARWSGQVIEPMDHVAYIGRNPGDRHVWIATGDSGNGMTHGAIAGLLIADGIEDIDNPWASLFDPSRKTLRALPTWVSENAQVAWHYRDLLTPGEVAAVDDVPHGHGRILRDGLRKLAVFRDTRGVVSVRSAVCPHLGCIVDWNSAEQTWDCPCHGSRFTPTGEVVNGPAVSPLPPADVPRDDAAPVGRVADLPPA